MSRILVLCAAALTGLTGCSPSATIAALSGQAVINPPPGLMQPVEPFVPLLWPGAGPVPPGDEALQPVAGQAAAPPVAPMAALPKVVPFKPVAQPKPSDPARAAPVGAPVPVVPAPPTTGPKETGKAPYPVAPPR